MDVINLSERTLWERQHILPFIVLRLVWVFFAKVSHPSTFPSQFSNSLQSKELNAVGTSTIYINAAAIINMYN